MRKTWQIFLYLTVTLITFIILNSGCASRGVPSGGPVDKTPPEIINTFPGPDSTNVYRLSVINVEFSEPIEESSIANNIFISPPLDFKAEWDSYTRLTINLNDSLKNNQTYVVVLGAKIKDIRGNQLAGSYQLAFSTGNKIDKGKISGKVYGLKRNQVVSIFGFALNGVMDTLRFDKNKPDYVSQTGNKGTFRLNYLRMGKYRVFAVEDQNNNLKMDADFEQIAIPVKDILLDSSDFDYQGLNFRLTKVDTIAPVLSNVRSQSSTFVNLRLSEKVIISSKDQISITDSISKHKIDVLATSVSEDADNVLDVYTTRMDSGHVYLCSVNALKDSSGNISPDTTISFVASRYVQPDTFKILNFTPMDSSWSLHPDTKIYLDMSNPVDIKSFEKNFSVISKGGDTIPGSFKNPSAFESEFSPAEFFKLDSIYSIHLNLKYITSIWGDTLGDSLLVRHFKISNGDDYGEISGSVFVQDSVFHPVFIKATKVNRKNENYYVWILKQEPFLLNYIPDGNYKMSAFFDKDSNGSFSPGNLFPFQFSEPFIFSDDTVKVRKRWETSGVNLHLPRSY